MSKKLSADVYTSMSGCKDFGFRDQITRSGLSIPCNIAEGMEKKSVNEQIRYLEIAKGSAAEFITQVYIGMDVRYISDDKGKEWLHNGEKLLGMLTKLQQYLKSRPPSKNT